VEFDSVQHHVNCCIDTSLLSVEQTYVYVAIAALLVADGRGFDEAGNSFCVFVDLSVVVAHAEIGVG
jgi:hypothetical protein